MSEHCEGQNHNECDGLLVGKGGQVCACICHEPLTNDERYWLRLTLRKGR